MPVTVRQAIRRGSNILTLPSVLLFAAGAFGGIISGVTFHNPGWITATIVVAGVVSSFVYWYMAVTKWKIWAYENVDHIHEFQLKAIEAKLLVADGSFSDRLAYKSAADKKRLAELQERFKQKDVYTDDIMVPAETRVFFSKKASGAMIAFAILMVGGGIYLLSDKNTIFGGVLIAFGIYQLYKAYAEYTNTTPQIILNADGIETVKTPFQKWADVQNERVQAETYNKTTTWYLVYDYPEGKASLDMTDLEFDAEKLEDLMHVYRARSEKAKH